MSSNNNLALEARFAMYGRLLRCPLGDNPEECPLCDIRKLPMEKRITWLESKTDQEVIELYDLHSACLTHKLEITEQPGLN